MSVATSKIPENDQQALEDQRPTKKRRKTSKHHDSSEDESHKRTKSDRQEVIQANSEPQTSQNISEPSSDNESLQNFEMSSEIDNVSSCDSDSNASDISSTESQKSSTQKKRKRNDPDIFATSMSKILGSKLTSLKRNDPVLARSAQAQYISKQATDAKLESLAKRKIRADKREALKKGRIFDVLGTDMASENPKISNQGTIHKSSQMIIEQERKLKKIAQRGVVKLFNAVRAAQIKGEEAAREAKAKGIVSQRSKEEKVNEMSKKGFLDLILKGSGNTNPETIENV